MKQISTFIFILSSIICLGQKKEEQKTSYDSTIVLNNWVVQQIKSNNAEIKRLGGTTIEAEQQRLSEKNQLLLNSFIAAKVPDLTRIENIAQPSEDKITLTLKPKKK